MTNANFETLQHGKSWDTYWRGSGDAGAFSSGGAGHPAIRAFWSDFFQSVKQRPEKPAIVDIASGNGFVVERAIEVFDDQPAKISCVDVSAAAIAVIQQRFPGVDGVVADAQSIPLETAAFDVVTSQYGVEYAGLNAVDEAVRLLAPGGQLAFLLHIQAGSIEQECARNLEAITRVQDANFLALATEMFRHGFEAVRGADRAAYDQAAKHLAPALVEFEGVLQEYGQQVADGTLARLYGDVANIHGQLTQYEPNEVLQWLQRMDEELTAFAGRMSSMLDAALDENEFEQMCNGLREGNFTIESAGPFLVAGSELPLAWALIARR